VDEGKVRWDQRVTELFPAFKLGDQATTNQVQVRHLVCACSGMPRQDLEWLFEYRNETPVSAMKLLGTMQPTSRFGEVFQYSNLMAAAAQRKAAIAKARARLVVPGRRGSSREAGAALREHRARRNQGREGRPGDGLRRRRVEEHRRLSKERRWDDLVHHDRSDAGRFEFVVADRDGKRRLITRDAQHEYIFEEAPAKKPS
jgi:Beta-lactamase